jgi:hypothetical protein
MQELDLSGDARTPRMPNGQTGRGLQSPWCSTSRRVGTGALTRGDPENGPVCDMIDRI